MKILVIAAHPDDEVLGCGGTITRFASEGAEVSILILANGLTSRTDFDATQEKKLLSIHHERARRAANILRAKEVNFAGFPDQRLDTLPLLEVTQRIEREINHIKPEVVFTHHGGDLNMDHSITFRATLTATRPVTGHSVRTLYSYETPSSTEWSFAQFDPQYKPNVFFDINSTLELKIEAMQVYESESRLFPHPRSPEVLRAIAYRWGSYVGLPAAEAFQCIRTIK